MPDIRLGGAFRDLFSVDQNNVPRFRGDDQVRLTYGEDGKPMGLEKSGERKGVFGRIKEHGERSRQTDTAKSERQQNRAVIREFIREIRQTYGAGAAAVVSYELRHHLSKGRPLTMHRMERMLGEAYQGMRLDLSRNERRIAQEKGMSPRLMGGYVRGHVRINLKTVPSHTSQDMVDQPKKLSGGALSDNYKVRYRNPDGNEVTKAVKIAHPDMGLGPAGELSGIQKGKLSCMPGRALGTYALSEKLGFDLVPRTTMLECEGRLGVGMDWVEGSTMVREEEILDLTDDDKKNIANSFNEGWFDPRDEELCKVKGYVLEFGENMIQVDGLGGEPRMQPEVVGVRVFKKVAVNMGGDEPQLRRDLVRLQLMDSLCGQVDRHGGNYVIQRDHTGKYLGLKAIDNDQSFGSKLTHPHDITKGWVDEEGGEHGNMNFHGVKLPMVVDMSTKKAFDEMTEESLRDSLKGLIPEKDIDSAVLRLRVIKDHLDKLEQSGNVLVDIPGREDGLDCWSDPRVGRLLGGPEDSYWGREKQNQSEDGARDFPLPPVPQQVVGEQVVN
ncbi:hypothetical protein DB346_08390 [Verrucomicrobia bacterium LW23]|nr:hypothetical protein DB346_08390 [Verrucomicrobia bacterium LW23]